MPPLAFDPGCFRGRGVVSPPSQFTSSSITIGGAAAAAGADAEVAAEVVSEVASEAAAEETPSEEAAAE